MDMSKNIKVNGINHLAISTSNMKEQITFFTDVLGMRLVALYWMHVVEGCWHGFLEMNENSALAFVFNPANAEAKIQPGITQPTNMTAGSAPARCSMLHLMWIRWRSCSISVIAFARAELMLMAR
jgi:catechol 2,3-dioxygenase-like lactoylglutathione lyase family enzyme